MNQDKKMGILSPAAKPGPLEPPAGVEEFEPKTAFGKELWTLRQKAVAGGMTLMTNDEILAEIESRRYGRLTESHD
ncbi:MAG: hypothetical protein LBV79_06630 [Candidatus Adiutrix sp.]|jgi:hypothetical protein|nr:hypothetical protein [Candidatus Adiutrix sp.]